MRWFGRIAAAWLATGLAFAPSTALAQGVGSVSKAVDPLPAIADKLSGVVIVHRRGERAFCSGTVLAGRLLVTARHCVQEIGAPAPYPVEEMRVGFGASTTDPDIVWRDVSRTLVLSDDPFRSVEDAQGRDVALIELPGDTNSAQFGVPQQIPELEPGETLTLIGFGEDRYGLVGTRHSVDVTVTGRTERGFTYTGGGCLGDSGGPLLRPDGTLVGIVSLGTTELCAPNYERVGQSLIPFIDFIVYTMLNPASLD
ncbi:MAG: trypsin-like serine protease [Pseudomonadota bacterium]